MSDSDDKESSPSPTTTADDAQIQNESENEPPQASGENVTYDENGDAIFADPKTNYKYKWCKDTSQWKPIENEHYRWCCEAQKWTPKVETENEYYRWCEKTSQWIPKMTSLTQETNKDGVVYGYDEKEGCSTYTDNDGAVFFWDHDRKAWFPKVDDDFLAIYQLNYGFIDNTIKEDEKIEPKLELSNQSAPSLNENEQQQQGKKRKAPAAPPKWFEIPPEQNTKIYVSNLPLDITEEEFGELMNKCGLVMKDVKTGKLKLKLYRDSNGQLKGDGLCHYIKVSDFIYT